MPHAGEFAQLQVTPQTNVPALLNSWVNFGAGFTDAAYFKDPNGFVHLRGLVKNGTGIPTVIFTLPLGYRPGQDSIFAVLSNNALGRVNVLASGDVQAFAGSTVWVQLDGITFKAAP